jgi:hypothetical protein
MAFNPVITELTTAATDALIAVVALLCVALLNRYRSECRWRVRIWTWVFGLLALASVLGALAHGLDLALTVRTWLWRPLYLSLGLVVALFVVGAVGDFTGKQAVRLALVPMLGLALGFFVITQVATGSFLVFVVYEALAMLTALVMYLLLAVKRQLAGAGIIAAGILLNIAAAAVQAVDSISITIVVPFDHNGVFHLVQIVALTVLTAGLVRGMDRQPAEQAGL